MPAIPSFRSAFPSAGHDPMATTHAAGPLSTNGRSTTHGSNGTAWVNTYPVGSQFHEVPRTHSSTGRQNGRDVFANGRYQHTIANNGSTIYDPDGRAILARIAKTMHTNDENPSTPIVSATRRHIPWPFLAFATSLLVFVGAVQLTGSAWAGTSEQAANEADTGIETTERQAEQDRTTSPPVTTIDPAAESRFESPPPRDQHMTSLSLGR